MDIIYTIIGLILLFAGGEVLLRASIAIAGKLGLSALLVSMVVIGFGTSTPELIVSLGAVMKGSPDIAFGNIVGSNIANVLLVLGISAIITPIICKKPEIRRDALAVLASCALLVGLSFTGQLERWMGLIMATSLIGYLVYAYRQESNNNKKLESFPKDIEEEVSATKLSWPQTILLTVASLGCLGVGAWLLIEGASSIALKMGIPEAIIGLSLVAVGSSLPELTMVILAAGKKNTDVIIGNIMGSNLFNTLGILGITSLVTPLPFPSHIAHFDIWIMLFVMVILVPVIWTGHKINRFEGAFFLCLYSGYVVWLYAS